jgi:3-mercaptopyruvate sulfurtransferase SseA
VASYFIRHGYPRVFALAGGWYAWQKAGLPVQDK